MHCLVLIAAALLLGFGVGRIGHQKFNAAVDKGVAAAEKKL